MTVYQIVVPPLLINFITFCFTTAKKTRKKNFNIKEGRIKNKKKQNGKKITKG